MTILAYIVYKFNGANTFASGFFNSYIIWVAVCCYDGLILDCIFFCNIKRFRIPGTEDMKEYKRLFISYKRFYKRKFNWTSCMLFNRIISNAIKKYL